MRKTESPVRKNGMSATLPLPNATSDRSPNQPTLQGKIQATFVLQMCDNYPRWVFISQEERYEGRIVIVR